MKIYTIADNITSPLGSGTRQNFEALLRLQSGIQRISNEKLSPTPFFGAAMSSEQQAETLLLEKYTRLEQGFIRSIGAVLNTIPGINKEKLVLVISSTKGNIDLIGQMPGGAIPAERLRLPAMARAINQYFKLPHEPVVVSNACISGVSAILTARKLIAMGLYDHALVAGGDLLDKFIISGFQSFKALSEERCRPYDANRSGINLGEAIGTLLISKDSSLQMESISLAIIAGGGQANDANHISGPSRTGKGLKLAIGSALRSAGLAATQIGYINAHGTATPFNDEMEAIAFSDMGMEQIPLNSLKAYYGHTLGAAGVIESIITIWQLNRQLLLQSLGYTEKGVSRPLHVLQEHQEVNGMEAVMKTASGFGGCNAAVIFQQAWN